MIGGTVRNIPRIAVILTALVVLFVGLRTVRQSRRQLADPDISPIDRSGPLTFFIADGAGRSGYLPGDPELALWALQAWQRAIGTPVHFEEGIEPTALVRLYWADPQDGQFGEMLPLAVDGRRGAAVYIRPDLDSLGPEIAASARADALLRDSIVYLTCLHELGHALGLEHTQDFRDIMYYFGYGGDIVAYFQRYRSQIHARSDIAGVSGLSDADVKRIRAMYAQQ